MEGNYNYSCDGPQCDIAVLTSYQNNVTTECNAANNKNNIPVYQRPFALNLCLRVGGKSGSGLYRIAKCDFDTNVFSMWEYSDESCSTLIQNSTWNYIYFHCVKCSRAADTTTIEPKNAIKSPVIHPTIRPTLQPTYNSE
eukprot:289262_1